MAKLTVKQRLFVDEYLIDKKQGEAAIRAGYSAKNADSIAARLVKKSQVKQAIDEALAIQSRRTGITADRVLQELAKLAFINPTDVINLDEATIRGEANRDDTAAIQSVRVKRIPTECGDIVEREVKVYNKVDALKSLGQHLGMFKNEIDLSLNAKITIVDDIDG